MCDVGKRLTHPSLHRSTVARRLLSTAGERGRLDAQVHVAGSILVGKVYQSWWAPYTTYNAREGASPWYRFLRAPKPSITIRRTDYAMRRKLAFVSRPTCTAAPAAHFGAISSEGKAVKCAIRNIPPAVAVQLMCTRSATPLAKANQLNYGSTIHLPNR